MNLLLRRIWEVTALLPSQTTPKQDDYGYFLGWRAGGGDSNRNSLCRTWPPA